MTTKREMYWYIGAKQFILYYLTGIHVHQQWVPIPHGSTFSCQLTLNVKFSVGKNTS